MVDPLRYYDLEAYLLNDVRLRFHAHGFLGAFDFFSIVIWKANRAKTHVARRLLNRDPKHRVTLEPIVRDLTRSLHRARSDEERMRVLLQDWGFALPMASAILAILWPDAFTVYDVRVCDQLGRFGQLVNRTKFESGWEGYRAYREAVRSAVPGLLALRDADRYLWAKSARDQMLGDSLAGC